MMGKIAPEIYGSRQISKQGNFHAKYTYYTKCKFQNISDTTVTPSISFKTNHKQNKEISRKFQPRVFVFCVITEKFLFMRMIVVICYEGIFGIHGNFLHSINLINCHVFWNMIMKNFIFSLSKVSLQLSLSNNRIKDISDNDSIDEMTLSLVYQLSTIGLSKNDQMILTFHFLFYFVHI
jgi:hypothetical protein